MRLRALGLREESVQVLFAHFDAAERAGKEGHGHSRIPWLETQEFDPAAVPSCVEHSEGFERWSGNGALGYLTLAAICRATLSSPPARARLETGFGRMSEAARRKFSSVNELLLGYAARWPTNELPEQFRIVQQAGDDVRLVRVWVRDTSGRETESEISFSRSDDGWRAVLFSAAAIDGIMARMEPAAAGHR